MHTQQTQRTYSISFNRSDTMKLSMTDSTSDKEQIETADIPERHTDVCQGEEGCHDLQFPVINLQ